MPSHFTASQMHDAYCKASGLNPDDHSSLLNRFRYMAKRGMLGKGKVVDDRGTLAFSKVQVFQAAIFTELAGLAMDLRAFEPIIQAAGRRHPNGLNVPPSMKRNGGWGSRGGLVDAIHGVSLGEKWSLQIRLKRPGYVSRGGISAEFVWDGGEDAIMQNGSPSAALGPDAVRTRASVDLTCLFAPLIDLIGAPDS